MRKERIVYTITEELIQSACKDNLGRELTDTELKRLHCVFIDHDKFYMHILDACVEAGNEAMNGDGWEYWDEDYKNTPLEELCL